MSNQVRYLALIGLFFSLPLCFSGPILAQSSASGNSENTELRDAVLLTNDSIVEEDTFDSSPLIGSELADLETADTLPNLIPQRTETGDARPYAYTLGPGDQIQIDIFNVPEFSGPNGTYFIPLNGDVQFPWIGQMNLEGLTIAEAVNELTGRYSLFINNPCLDAQPCQFLTLKLLQPRPMRVNITGEVNRPGVYVVGNQGGGFNSQLQTVTSAVQLAGGITQLADVRNISVYRPQQFGDDVIFPVNFWTLLQEGALEQDVVLRDGDRIVIPTASILENAEITQLATANFSPATIQVNVVGEVDAPGIVELPPNASMNQAILAAGGLDKPRAKDSKVEFIRLNPDGTVTKRTIPLELEDSLNEETNPALRGNDIIIVRRSSLTRISDYLGALAAPFNPLLSIGAIFRLFGN